MFSEWIGGGQFSEEETEKNNRKQIKEIVVEIRSIDRECLDWNEEEQGTSILQKIENEERLFKSKSEGREPIIWLKEREGQTNRKLDGVGYKKLKPCCYGKEIKSTVLWTFKF